MTRDQCNSSEPFYTCSANAYTRKRPFLSTYFLNTDPSSSLDHVLVPHPASAFIVSGIFRYRRNTWATENLKSIAIHSLAD